MSPDLLAFQLVAIPASGAFATLCLAQRPDGTPIALKVLRSDHLRNADALTRLRDEARVLRRLRHPHIVRVDDLAHLDGRPVLFMEWIDGLSLDALVRRFPEGVPGPVAVTVARHVALALGAAHDAPVGPDERPMRIVHRDIKPDNVLLSCRGEVKVVDFGLATGDFQDRESRSGVVVVGSRGYSAPERLDGEADTPAVDVYALGITLVELLTGKVPVISRRHDRHDAAVVDQLAHVHPGGLHADAADRLRGLVRRMCAYEPAERPGHAEVARALLGILDGHEADLSSFAGAEVAPVVAAREHAPPEESPHYDEVRFLEAFDEWDTLDEPNTTEAASDAELRQFLRTRTWSRHVPELQLLLASSARWTPRPFLEILARARRPRWQFWTSRPTADEVALALEFLRQRADDVVRAAARPFANHGDERISSAARALLDR